MPENPSESKEEPITIFVNPNPFPIDEKDRIAFMSKKGTFHDFQSISTREPDKLPEEVKQEIGDWKPVRVIRKKIEGRIAEVFVAVEDQENSL